MKRVRHSPFSSFFPALLAATFTTIALAGPGSLDPGFAGTGIIRTGFGGGSAGAYATAVQSDGKLILAGSGYVGSPRPIPAFALIRLDTNNLMDPSFGDHGKVLSFPGTPQSTGSTFIKAVKIQADGKILAAGCAFNAPLDPTHAVFTLARYTTNGVLDTTFGTNGTGIVYAYFGGDKNFVGNAVANSIAIQADGRIVVAGIAADGAALARYSTNGVPDPTFGTGGQLVTSVGYGFGANAMMIESDGRIFAVGTAPGSGSIDFSLFCYTTNGVLDTTFGSGTGKVLTAVGGTGTDNDGNAIGIQTGTGQFGSTDKIVVAGGWHGGAGSGLALARYNLDGTLDSSFGIGGVVSNNAPSGMSEMGQALVVQGIFTQPRSFTVGGYFYNGTNQSFELAHYTAVGALDTTFGGNGTGKVILPIGATAYGYGLVVASGKFVLAGSVVVTNNNSIFAAARFSSSGVPDTTFGSNGVVTADISDLISQAAAVAVQPDGAIVVAGRADNGNGLGNEFAVARYHADGTLDTNFDTDGKVVTVVGTNAAAASAVLVQPDKKIVAAGNANNAFALVRYSTNGGLDSFFGTAGKVITPIGTSHDAVNALALQPDGKIVAAGQTYNGANLDFALVRYTTNGALDTTFNGSGKVTTAISTGDDSAYGIGIQSDGKIVLAGQGTVSSSLKFALTRYTTNGVLDTSFGSLGRVVTDFGSGTTAQAFAMALQPDSRIIVAGAVTIGGEEYFGLARYLTNGTLDSSFGTGGKVNTPIGLVLDFASAVTLQADGKILATGQSQVGTLYQFATVRYNPDGSLDTAYGIGGKSVINFGSGTNEYGYAEALDPQGRLVVAGAGGGLFGIARLVGNPYLNIFHSLASALLVTWPYPSTGWNLQQSTNLATASWATPPETVNNDGTNNYISISSPSSRRFFRLKSP